MFRRKKPEFSDSPSVMVEEPVPPSSGSTPAVSQPVAMPLAPSPNAAAIPPLARAGSAAAAKPQAPNRPETPRRLAEISTPVSNSEGKKLTVGRDIALSGSINSCERLIVEGSVEADLTDALALEVTEGGIFRGKAEVDDADIAGTLEGTLIVRKKLSVRATGVIKGSVKYARMSIDLGGKVDGSIEPLPSDGTEPPLRSPLIPNYRSE